MYNKKKFVIGLIGSILAMVLGGIFLVSSALYIAALVKLPSSTSPTGFTAFIFVLGLAVRIYLGMLLFGYGRETISKPFYYTTTEPPASFWLFPAKGKNIALIVLSGCILLLSLLLLGNASFISDTTCVSLTFSKFSLWIKNLLGLSITCNGISIWSIVMATLQWQQLLLCAGILVLKIVFLCLNSNSENKDQQ